MIEIFVPTYNRQNLPILKLLEDKNIFLHLCLRHENFEDRKYFENYKNVDFIDLGSGIDNLGETRKRIVNYCVDNNIKYCTMLDDSLTSIKDLEENLSPSECVEKAIKFLQNKQKEHNEVFCYTLFRKGNKFLGVEKNDEYFVGLPLQAEIIDIEYIKKYNINYEDMKICGLEDVAFFVDAVKAGLIFVSNQNIVIDGKLPNVIVEGGSHSEDAINFEKKRDNDHKILMNYVGNMYGIMLTKKYRESLGFSLTYARIDFSYFRDVLVYHRKENEKIIQQRFMII